MNTPEHRFHMMVVHRSTKSALFAALLFIASLFAAEVVYAGLIFDPADPALTGSTSVALDESIGLTPGLQNLQTVQNGVTFDFSTANSDGLYFDLDPDVALASYSPEGTEVLIEPPVEAIGFVLRYSTCTGTITFDGEIGSETFETQEMPVDLFIGAAEIGDIFSVTLNATCEVSLWSQMIFVPSEGGPPPPLNTSNLGIIKTGPVGAISQANNPVVYTMPVGNLGPDTAVGARAVDFLPPGTTVVDSAPPATLNATGTIATMTLGDITDGATSTATLGLDLPPFVPIPGVGRVFGCEDTLVNVALATSNSIETDPGDNLSMTSNIFDKSARSGVTEICDNGVDDNCDGLVDCGDAACGCLPPLGAARGAQAPDRCTATFPSPADCPVIVVQPRERTDDCMDAHGNEVDPPHEWCCDFNLRRCLNPTESPPDCDRISQAQFNNECDFPVDPNFKEADPYVNAFGYGYTEAGRTMNYVLHYENIGGADAHDVSIIDVLDDDLDDTTLVVNDGGAYDAANRTLLWRDAVVPPATPRSVSFSADVRADAPPATRVRNVGTIVFPDALPPSRIDTNLVEHVITDPQYPVVENLKVFQCTETGPGSNEWQVNIVNEGFGFAYNVNATILDPPAPVQVTDGMASFAHADEVIAPLPNTLTDNGDGTVTQVRDDPTYGDGSALMWLKDANFAQTDGYDTDGLMTWDEASAWIAYMNTTDFDSDGTPGYANYNDWRLPQHLPVNGTSYNGLFSYDGSTDNGYNITSPNVEMAYMFHVELGNLGNADTSGNAPQPGWGLSNSGPFINLQSTLYYWSGTEWDVSTSFAWVFIFSYGNTGLLAKDNPLNAYAWAMRDVTVPDPDAPTTVIPLAYTTSTDTVTFTTETPADPCGALTWRIEYERPVGAPFTVDVQDKPDADLDAVADAADNCPEDYNPTQDDSDGDGIGDACEEVEVVCVDDLQARPKSGKVQLTWAHTGADAYNVYRSGSSGGPYVLIANTTSTYSTYLDSNLVNGVTYYYVVREVALNTDELCQSNEASATPQARTRR